MIVVSGRLQIRNWTDDSGNKRTTAEIVADNVYFGGSKKKEETTSGTTTPYYGYVPVTSDFAMLDDDDAQLPF
jgi:single-strand DNA-binding protein